MMIRALFLTCALLACAASVALAQGNPVIPTLPDDFTAKIEANFAGRNYSLEIFEAYDYKNDRVRISSHVAGGVETVTVWKYDQLKKFDLVPSNRTCKTTDIDANDFRLNTNNFHVKKAADIFRTSGQFTYEGVGSVRGIQVDQYIGNASLPSFGSPGSSFNFTMEWFFSTASWSFKDDRSRVPVRLIVKGTINRGPAGDLPFENYYEFIDFIPGTPDPELFHVAHDIAIDCPSVNQQPGVLPRALPQIPDDFESFIEITNVKESKSTARKELYAYAKDRLRVDSFTEGYNQIEVYRFDQDAKYTINADTGVCRYTKVESDDFLVSKDDPHQVKHASELFRINKNENYTYEGVERVRGIECDYWISHRELEFPFQGENVQMTISVEWYFAVGNWSMPGNTATSGQIPIRAVASGLFRNNTGAAVNATSVVRTGTHGLDTFLDEHAFYTNYEFVQFIPQGSDDYSFYVPDAIDDGCRAAAAVGGAGVDQGPNRGAPVDFCFQIPDGNGGARTVIDNSSGTTYSPAFVGVGFTLSILFGVVLAGVLLLVYRKCRKPDFARLVRSNSQEERFSDRM